MSWIPHIEGALPIQAPNARFIAALRQRVENGLFTGQHGAREHYEIVKSDPEFIRVRAVGWWTAINVGLNDLKLNFSESGKLQFRLSYWRWAAYCIVHCAVLGLAGAASFLALDIRSYIANHPGARFPSLSIDQNLDVVWSTVLFWGLVWPWVLIALHKRPLRRLVERLITEIDAKANAET